MRNHVLVQFHVPQIRIAPVKVSLAVVVDENRRIDVPHAFIDQWMPENILEGSERTVGHCHGYHVLRRSRNTDRNIEVELALPLDRLWCPCVVALNCPRESRQRSNSSVICPVHHVSGRGEATVEYPQA